VNGGVWDITVIRMRYIERQLLPEADVQRSPDRHRRTTKTGPVADRQVL